MESAERHKASSHNLVTFPVGFDPPHAGTVTALNDGRMRVVGPVIVAPPHLNDVASHKCAGREGGRVSVAVGVALPARVVGRIRWNRHSVARGTTDYGAYPLFAGLSDVVPDILQGAFDDPAVALVLAQVVPPVRESGRRGCALHRKQSEADGKKAGGKNDSTTGKHFQLLWKDVNRRTIPRHSI